MNMKIVVEPIYSQFGKKNFKMFLFPCNCEQKYEEY